MESLTIIVPFWNGHATIQRLVNSLPPSIPVIIVNDYGSATPKVKGKQVRVISLDKRGYFSGACNAGFTACAGDVLILNQDVWFKDSKWLAGVEQFLQMPQAGVYGDGVFGHPAWPNGYVQGTFMAITRKAIDTVGGFNASLYPLWGATAEYQARVCRAGLKAYPLPGIQGMAHADRHKSSFGAAITQALKEEPVKKSQFIRTPPEISVIIPEYNYGRYVGEAVTSVLAQTFQSFEIIIVDDASTDGSAATVAKMVDAWKAIRVIQHKHNGGTAQTLNTGIKAARGKYIYILSADDKIKPWTLERLYAAQQQNPHSFIYGNVTFFTGAQETVMKVQAFDFDKLLYKNHVPANILYPKAAWEEVGGYPAIMNDGREDWAMAIALGRAGWCGVHIGDSGALVRREKQNRTLRTSVWGNSYFLNKLKTTFPDVYQGRYPMACCGARGTRAKAVSNTTVLSSSSVMNEPLSATDVRLVYIGANTGRETIYGPSGRRYKYGRTARYIYLWAAAEDVKFLLETKMFALSPVKSTPVVAVEVQAAEVQPVTLATVVAGVEDVDVYDEPVEDTVFSRTLYAETAPEPVLAYDPSAMTVSQIMELDLDADAAQALLDVERAGKARRSAITYLEGLLDA